MPLARGGGVRDRASGMSPGLRGSNVSREEVAAAPAPEGRRAGGPQRRRSAGWPAAPAFAQVNWR